MNNSQIFMKKYSPTILTVIGSAGVIITTVLAVKSTPKALKLIEEAKNTKEEDLTVLETIKVAWMPYIPAAISALSTILCISGANYLNAKKQKNLASAYILLDNAFKGYCNKVTERYGSDVDKDIRNEVIREQFNENSIILGEGDMMFFEFNSLRFFESDIHTVMQAECKAIEQFDKYGHLSLNDYYSYLGIPPCEDYGECIGWSSSQMYQNYREEKLEFKYERNYAGNGVIYYTISTNIEPTLDYFIY